jgi:hypothetical protein
MKKLAYTIAIVLLPAGAASAAGLADMDADGNGMLSLTELQSAYPDLTQDGFTAIDANADGSVDEAELTAAIDAGKLPASG